MNICLRVCKWNIPIVFFLFCHLSLNAIGYKSDYYKYTIEAAGLGTQDNMLYKVICWVKNPSSAVETASINVVHGILFTGCSASAGIPEQVPLVQSPTLSKEQHTYFDAFFHDRKYNQYIASVARNNLKITKMKKQYQVEVVVAVNKRKLRQDLEKAGIIKKLGALFEK